MTYTIPSFSYHIPTAIEFGWGSLARLPSIVKGLGGTRAFVVGDPGVVKAARIAEAFAAGDKTFKWLKAQVETFLAHKPRTVLKTGANFRYPEGFLRGRGDTVQLELHIDQPERQAALLEEEPTPQFDQTLKVRLQQLMHQEKPHLHPNLTLEQLSRKLGAPSREVSRAINQGFGCNFFEFVSRYRIDEAKSRLADAANQANILQTMYDSGFNSKSVFNTAFKKETGFTPSEYRRRALQGDIRP